MKSITDYLATEFTNPIKDPLWGHIYLSSGMKEIINSQPFLRLSRIRQLGPAFLIYPGATHTRFNHSLGVFHLAYRMMLSLTLSSNRPSLTLTGVISFLTAALLHDLGHFPYAHSLKELPLKDHEALSAEIILNSELKSIIDNKVDGSAELTAAIIDEKSNFSNDSEVKFYRSLLSGVLDPDKLDYLNRDAFFCGVPYGSQDTDEVLRRMIPSENGVIMPEVAISSIENILFSKYMMYRSVYWHPKVRVATAVNKKCCYLALERGLLKPEQLYGMDDEAFRREISALPGSLDLLFSNADNPYLYKTVVELDFNGSNNKHSALTNLEVRTLKERETAEAISKITGNKIREEEVIIDIPENVSFEIDLPIEKNNMVIPFIDSGTLFSRKVVDGFTSALRKIRVFLPGNRCKNLRSEEILNIIDL